MAMGDKKEVSDITKRVQDIIKTGLKKGKYYKVYVTQVNQKGIESQKSDPVLIRVGDTQAPPIPVLLLDTSFGTSGFKKNRGAVDIGLKWGQSICDDLSHYVLYTWHSWKDWDKDGVKLKTIPAAATNMVIQNTATSYVLAGQRNQEYLWIGIQAVDLSNNHSDIYVMRVLVEDTSILEQPAEAPTCTPGVWKIKVSINCPQSTQIQKIAIYRDNQTTTFDGRSCVGLILFYPGMVVSYVDALEVLDGLTHFYTYAWVDYNGNVSPRSPASTSVTAKAIDTELIDKEVFKALNNAWMSEFISDGGVVDIEKLKTDLITQTKNVISLANQLTTVQDNFNGLYDKYNLLVNSLRIISAKVDKQDESMIAMQTQIQQNAKEIDLRATQTTLNNMTNQITNAYKSLYQQNAQGIATVVSNLNNNVLSYTGIAQMANAIQFKVDVNGIKTAINMSNETVQIEGKHLHVTAGSLFDGDVRINGILNADSIYQAGYKVRNSVMSKGLVNRSWIPLPDGYSEDQCQWGIEAQPKSVNITMRGRYIEAVQTDGHGSDTNIAVRYWIMGVK